MGPSILFNLLIGSSIKYITLRYAQFTVPVIKKGDSSLLRLCLMFHRRGPSSCGNPCLCGPQFENKSDKM